MKVVFVSGEPVWPACHGGRIRAARVAGALSRHFDLVVAAPLDGPAELRCEPLPDDPPGRRFTRHPRLGRALLGPRRQAALRSIVERERPGAVLFAAGYLAAVAPAVGVPVAVDFMDVEVRRMASFARAPGTSIRSRGAAAVEAVKARAWEPRLARRAALAAVTSVGDARLLSSWGVPQVVHVPHGADRRAVIPSPERGPVTLVSSFDYAPNAAAARFVLDQIRPLLPGIPLRLAGRCASRVDVPAGVDVVSDPEDMDAVYEGAALVLAPVRAGGGHQLKVVEALSHGRAVVATSYSARSVPGQAAGAALVADRPDEFAAHVAHLWHDVAARRAAEKALAGRPIVPTWDEACAPLVEALARLG